MGRFVAGGGGDEAMRLRPRLARNRSMTKAAAEHRRNTEDATRGIFARSIGRMIRRRAVRTAASAGLGRMASRAGAVGSVAVAAVVVAAAVSARLISGRSFENMGENLAATLLGDSGPESIARRRTREQMQASDGIMYAAGRSGITKQMRQMGQMLYEQNLREEKGKALFMRDKDYQVNGPLDMMILAFRNKLMALFSGGDVQHSLGKVTQSLNASASVMVYAKVQRATGAF